MEFDPIPKLTVLSSQGIKLELTICGVTIFGLVGLWFIVDGSLIGWCLWAAGMCIVLVPTHLALPLRFAYKYHDRSSSGDGAGSGSSSQTSGRALSYVVRMAFAWKFISSELCFHLFKF